MAGGWVDGNRPLGDTPMMFRTLGRLLVLRFIPRRLLPVLTAWEVVQLIRSRRRSRATGELEADVDARRTRPPSTARSGRR
jgi:hypothetical protein